MRECERESVCERECETDGRGGKEEGWGGWEKNKRGMGRNRVQIIIIIIIIDTVKSEACSTESPVRLSPKHFKTSCATAPVLSAFSYPSRGRQVFARFRITIICPSGGRSCAVCSLTQ